MCVLMNNGYIWIFLFTEKLHSQLCLIVKIFLSLQLTKAQLTWLSAGQPHRGNRSISDTRSNPKLLHWLHLLLQWEYLLRKILEDFYLRAASAFTTTNRNRIWLPLIRSQKPLCWKYVGQRPFCGQV